MGKDIFSGRTAVVTGGARGLGLAMATALAENGANVALLDLLPSVSEVATELQGSTGQSVIGHAVDVTSEASIDQAFNVVHEELGIATILVNSAGASHGATALDTDANAWRRIMDINLTGTFLTSKAFAQRAIAASLPASVINVSSMSGFVVNIPQTQAAYNTSKAGVAMLTKSLAVEWLQYGIRVNAIAPGYFASDMTRDFVASHPEMADARISKVPMGRMGEPNELGPLVVFLASDDSKYVVGQNILIDGGYTLV